MVVSFVPEPLVRHPTAEAIAALAARFGLPNHPGMQDWEYEVSDPARVDEFLAAYKLLELSEDERFVLMATIIDSFEELLDAGPDPRWSEVLRLLEADFTTHVSTVHYWASGSKPLADCWRVTPDLRHLRDRLTLSEDG